MNYTILTSKSVLSLTHEDDNESELLVEEQNKVLSSLGYTDIYNQCYVVKFGDKRHCCLTTIDDSIQRLALKDGADLVRFDDGFVGYVGYYNGFSLDENNFKIIRKPTDRDIAIDDGDIDGYIEM